VYCEIAKAIKDRMKECINNGAEAERPIGTFAFFDLEATGLPGKSTRITELSLVAVTRDDLKQLNKEVMRHNAGRVEDLEARLLPRVVNKLTACVYPWTTIPLHVEHITGLSNDNLEKQGRFDTNLVSSLASFLARLHPPVCLVAHNGFKFDFPLLQAELHKVNGSLADDLLCCDSWLGANHIYNNQSRHEALTNRLPQPAEKEKSSDKSDSLEEVAVAERLIEAGVFEDTLEVEEPVLVLSAQEEVMCRTPPRLSGECSSMSLTPPPSVGSKREAAELEFTSHGLVSPSKMMRPEGVLTPEIKLKSQVDVGDCPRLERGNIQEVKKKLVFSSRPTSFSLVNLHKHLLGAAPKFSHGAEADCLALLRVTAAFGQDWLSYADNHALPFNNIVKMW